MARVVQGEIVHIFGEDGMQRRRDVLDFWDAECEPCCMTFGGVRILSDNGHTHSIERSFLESGIEQRSLWTVPLACSSQVGQLFEADLFFPAPKELKFPIIHLIQTFKPAASASSSKSFAYVLFKRPRTESPVMTQVSP